MNSIRTLPEDVVNLIAASEVIDSLAAVVRELVENALDAGATRISVYLWPGQWRVRVADNGIGLDLPDLERAAMPHSTSKIADIADLSKISSLGFRGEALHSLAQLSDLEILSRPRVPSAEGGGWRVVYDRQGEPQTVEDAAIAPGTVVTVSNLFGPWETRRQALPSPSQQLRGVQLMLQAIALCHPRVTWQVHQNDRPWLQFGPGTSAREILPKFIKGVRVGDLQYLKVQLAEPPREESHGKWDDSIPMELDVTVGLPDRCHRRRPDWIKVAVNGRMVRSPELEPTLLSAFARTCPRDRYPVCFVHLHIHPAFIDWNRHPAKAEIYLHHLEHWQEQIRAAIERTLHLNPDTLAGDETRMEKFLRVSEGGGNYRTRPTPPDTVEDGGGLAVLKLRALAQVHNTYIVCEHPDGLWLVEQHIAHERVIYEELCDRWQLVPLDSPIILQNLCSSQLEQLDRLDLEVDPFGEGLWAVRSAPEPLARRDDCADALLELSSGGDLQSAQVATACRTAIRNGTPLDLAEMQGLLDRWVRTRHPRTCPHGRPIFLRLDESSLSRFFRRHWVIGKSHGI
ncbi:DNA mismatch repair endonuclease MutL [Lyngbya sp. CCY1209]|uniref:DNA mismatch repair endonuclease MutL n=1 Tax=Lyngbya sp. CCY1209 TaxID=2886103 RepID=UPI002D20B726|nr:DNA mismatch repair endonuclease MutL [Lyngbya sp. CCY1209]MEB3884895.1 DNA mismatch repair endonuclease MutL [Lyngbya sp. CCY1209]